MIKFPPQAIKPESNPLNFFYGFFYGFFAKNNHIDDEISKRMNNLRKSQCLACKKIKNLYTLFLQW